MNTLQLDPCPFCGGDESEENATQMRALYLRHFPSPIGKMAYRVECRCGVQGAADLDIREAAGKWNTRTTRAHR